MIYLHDTAIHLRCFSLSMLQTSSSPRDYLQSWHYNAAAWHKNLEGSWSYIFSYAANLSCGLDCLHSLLGLYALCQRGWSLPETTLTSNLPLCGWLPESGHLGRHAGVLGKAEVCADSTSSFNPCVRSENRAGVRKGTKNHRDAAPSPEPNRMRGKVCMRREGLRGQAYICLCCTITSVFTAGWL